MEPSRLILQNRGDFVQMSLVFGLETKGIGAEVYFLSLPIDPFNRMAVLADPDLGKILRVLQVGEYSSARDRGTQIHDALVAVSPRDLQHAMNHRLGSDDAG